MKWLLDTVDDERYALESKLPHITLNNPRRWGHWGPNNAQTVAFIY